MHYFLFWNNYNGISPVFKIWLSDSLLYFGPGYLSFPIVWMTDWCVCVFTIIVCFANLKVCCIKSKSTSRDLGKASVVNFTQVCKKLFPWPRSIGNFFSWSVLCSYVTVFYWFILCSYKWCIWPSLVCLLLILINDVSDYIQWLWCGILKLSTVCCTVKPCVHTCFFNTFYPQSLT